MTRREALKNLSYLLWIPFAWIMIKLNQRQNLLKGSHAEVRIPAALPEGVSFYGAVIVSKTANKIQFLSSRCTHLGCTITKEEQGILSCPCHGSAYDRNGKIISGPAVKSLENLTWRVDEKTGDFLVKTVS